MMTEKAIEGGIKMWLQRSNIFGGVRTEEEIRQEQRETREKVIAKLQLLPHDPKRDRNILSWTLSSQTRFLNTEYALKKVPPGTDWRHKIPRGKAGTKQTTIQEHVGGAQDRPSQESQQGNPTAVTSGGDMGCSEMQVEPRGTSTTACAECGIPGHNIRNCNMKSASKCSVCRSPWHTKRKCPEAREEEEFTPSAGRCMKRIKLTPADRKSSKRTYLNHLDKVREQREAEEEGPRTGREGNGVQRTQEGNAIQEGGTQEVGARRGGEPGGSPIPDSTGEMGDAGTGADEDSTEESPSGTSRGEDQEDIADWGARGRRTRIGVQE